VLRPQLRIFDFIGAVRGLTVLYDNLPEDRRDEIMESAEIIIKYSGYIEREKGIADKLNRLENIDISRKFDYMSLESLSTEARQKLDRIQPGTIGQASRISGVSPSDINVLLVLLGR
jgi:tRNA uridine 5-carboxymethylaminomethyl modification enzyme